MVSSIQKEKAELFLKYHQDKEILVLLNSWDIGSSKLIEASGYKAIATTSMGIAASLGYPDCQIIQLSEMIHRRHQVTEIYAQPLGLVFGLKGFSVG